MDPSHTAHDIGKKYLRANSPGDDRRPVRWATSRRGAPHTVLGKPVDRIVEYPIGKQNADVTCSTLETCGSLAVTQEHWGRSNHFGQNVNQDARWYGQVDGGPVTSPLYGDAACTRPGVAWPRLEAGVLANYSPMYLRNASAACATDMGYIAVIRTVPFQAPFQTLTQFCDREIPPGSYDLANRLCKLDAAKIDLVYQVYHHPNGGYGCERVIYVSGHPFSLSNLQNWLRNGELKWSECQGMPAPTGIIGTTAWQQDAVAKCDAVVSAATTPTNYYAGRYFYTGAWWLQYGTDNGLQ